MHTIQCRTQSILVILICSCRLQSKIFCRILIQFLSRCIIDIVWNRMSDTVNGCVWFGYIQMVQFLHLVQMIIRFAYGIWIQKNAKYVLKPVRWQNKKSSIIVKLIFLRLVAFVCRLNYVIMIIQSNVLHGPVKMHRKPSMKRPALTIKRDHIMAHS